MTVQDIIEAAADVLADPHARGHVQQAAEEVLREDPGIMQQFTREIAGRIAARACYLQGYQQGLGASVPGPKPF